MTPGKRFFDISLALTLIVFALPVLLVLIGFLIVTKGRPIFYISERMHSPTQSFALIKLRTMDPDTADGGVTGGNKSNALPPIYRILRKSRLDELPQLYNVLVGDMSFVGPRPPLKTYVTAFPKLYEAVLQNRPGVTGLASLRFHHYEERLLAACSNAAETDAVYRNRCVPRKATLDLIYQRHRSICFDLMLIWETARRPFQRH